MVEQVVLESRKTVYYKEIEKPVIIAIAPGAPGGPAPVGDNGSRSDFLKCAVSLVSVKPVAPMVANALPA